MQTFIFTNDCAILVAFQYTLSTFVISALKLLAVGTIIRVRHEFKIFGSVIILYFILMIHNEPIFITITEMESHKSMYLGTNMHT